MGAPYIYNISRLRVKDLHSATYIYVVRRLRVNCKIDKWAVTTPSLSRSVSYKEQQCRSTEVLDFVTS